MPTAKRRSRRGSASVCTLALLSGALMIPELAAPVPAAAATTCPSTSNVYVLEETPGPQRPGYFAKTLRKYVDFDPQGGGANAPLTSTEHTATVPWTARIVAGREGKFYIFDRDGVKSYRDATAEGGPLLQAVDTFADNGVAWLGLDRIWTSGNTILTINQAGVFEAYMESAKVLPTGKKTFMAVPGYPTPDAAMIEELRTAQDVWGDGGRLYSLKGGVLKKFTRTGPLGLTWTSAVIATGLTDAVQGWSPADGTVYTTTTARNYSGIVRGYTGTGTATLTPSNPNVMSGLYGEVLNDTATCLSPAVTDKPVVGSPVDDSGLPPAPVEPDPEPEPEPVGPRVVRGVFTLGDGKPAAGMSVLLETSDVAAENPATAGVTTLGTTTTAADGSWSFTLPEQLPAGVAAAATANGGALNVSATVAGTTSSGVPMVGLDHTVAAPADPATDAPTAFAASVSGEQHTIALIPAAAPDTSFAQPTTQQEASTYAEEQKASSIGPVAAVPTWQADNTQLAADYNPYAVAGTDVSGERVTPYASGNCYTLRTFVSSRIAYTTVAEGHAYWDSYATVDYDSKMSTTIDVAVSSGSNWKPSGTVSLAGSTGQSTGYTNQGPYFARQYQIPIEYSKYKYTYYCGAVPRSSYQKVIAGRYKIPSGGAVGKMGVDVRYKDGPNAFLASPTRNRAYVEPGSYFQLSKGRSAKWGGAVSVYGLSLGASTTYDREHKQRITAGKRTNSRHDIWGRLGPVWDNPGIFFSY
ncbi:hypothetical protein ACFWEO_32730 [Streptomyces roseolus]|uniref:hypothetical protein n=2 Tax=Streptomyces roseolus TaxID=67358 RepID=UPI0036419176